MQGLLCVYIKQRKEQGLYTGYTNNLSLNFEGETENAL